MEVDSVHHTIEQKIKNKAIYSPSDYVRFFREARLHPSPYKVNYLEHSFFQNYSDVCALKTIRPGKKAGDPQVVDIRGLKYSPDGQILFKLGHDEDWKKLFVRGNSSTVIGDPIPLLTAKKKLTAAKYTHLHQLKMVIPKDLHTFYDLLPHD
ncbi:hypothetical protein PoB_003529300 [Plakobranchus ocellatus]|uniref:Uncharacterized protein n=1 Tax=Plakobranchus ocellatus TaxID=259542 RepID=A0AAV4AQE6_9GAST|nr:hypothetical protein PoB_003529300 [Plakobranchus ocellatus]